MSDDRLCKIKMIGEIRQNFTEASASVGLILATAQLRLIKTNLVNSIIRHRMWLYHTPKIIFFLQGKINCSTVTKNNTNNLLQHSPPLTHLESSIRRDFHCESGAAFLRGMVLVQFSTARTDLSASPCP